MGTPPRNDKWARRIGMTSGRAAPEWQSGEGGRSKLTAVGWQLGASAGGRGYPVNRSLTLVRKERVPPRSMNLDHDS